MSPTDADDASRSPLPASRGSAGGGGSDRDSAAPLRILLIKPSSLGDIVHALPVLAALRRRCPDAHIAWLVSTSFAPLLDGHPLLDEVIRFDRRRFGAMWWNPAAFVAFWRFVAQIRRRRFDVVIDLQGLIRSGLIAWFSGARRRIGFADARELAWLFYTQRVAGNDELRADAAAGVIRHSSQHAVEKNRRVLGVLGAEASTPEFPLAVRPDELDEARRLLELHGVDAGAFCAVLPGARWESKLWPARRFGALLRTLCEQSRGPLVLLGAPEEAARTAEILGYAQLPDSRFPAGGVVDLVGRTTLRQLAALLALARLVICQDSGPMHIAAALNRPTLALFGPTDPARTGPWSAAAQVVTNPVECAPCLRRRCPLGHQACLAELSPEAVLAKVREVEERFSAARSC